VDSLGIYSSRCELMKGQHAQQQAKMKANKHTDAQQEWEGPSHGSPALLLLAPGWWPYRPNHHRGANELFR
jgi:hypothetical protein